MHSQTKFWNGVIVRILTPKEYQTICIHEETTKLQWHQQEEKLSF